MIVQKLQKLVSDDTRSQRELAELTGLSSATVWKIGNAGDMGLVAFVALCKLYGVAPSEALGFDPPDESGVAEYRAGWRAAMSLVRDKLHKVLDGHRDVEASKS